MARLINENSVMEFAEKCTFTDRNERKKYLDFVRYCVEQSKTAYDVEKVLHCIHEYFAKKINDCYGNIVPHEILEYNKAICEIVRKGGVE